MTPTELIALCARAQAHSRFTADLRQAVERFTAWEGLPELAETHGMAPLLYQHLRSVEAPWPAAVQLTLKGLVLRHQRAAPLYDRVLREVLQHLATAGIEALVLKGGALAHLIYPQPGLRPRRDLDILVRMQDVERAYQMLAEVGFSLAPSPMHGVSRYHQHLAPVERTIAGMTVSLDLHVNLFFRFKAYGLPQVNYAELKRGAIPFSLDGFTAYTLSPEAMLWHLYHHGFSAPPRVASQDRGRLLGAADIVSLVEQWYSRIDWERMQRCYPQAFHALPMFHFLTPWSDAVIEHLHLTVGRRPAGVGEVYEGYPKQMWAEHVRRGLRRSLRETFWPSEWWVRMYYGWPEPRSVHRGRLTHAGLVCWDLALYATSLLGPLKVHPYDD